MNELSAPIIEVAPLEPALRSFAPRAWADRLECWLEAERAQLAPWLTVAVGAGIAGWFALPDERAWAGLVLTGASLAVAGAMIVLRRLGQALLWFGLGVAVGCLLAWARAAWVAAPVLQRPLVTAVTGRVERVEPLVAKGSIRLTVINASPGLPRRIRVVVDQRQADPIAPGAIISVRARLAPPPPMALPGSHDYARDFWFQGIGATGKALGPVEIRQPGRTDGLAGLRDRLDRHVRSAIPGSAGGIATALISGNQHAVSDADAEAMRRSGLTHLLSVSGLHIAAVVAATMVLALRLFALSPYLALRFNLVLVAAAAGAGAAIFYTVLTGMQVPTVRSCLAALLVLAGMALGRDAISIRLVAAGALVVLLFRPEALPGASFQLSFAAVTAIVALHALPPVQRWFGPREEGLGWRFVRGAGSLLATGLAVEIALVPFALYHFHRAGLYGVGANLFAIPWTTFVIMPLEGLALLADAIGLGTPLWTLAGWSIDRLLAVAHAVAAMPGAVAAVPAIPRWAFAATVGGGLWVVLWRTEYRWLGLAPVAAGALAALAAPVPDLLVTGDGRHLALVAADGTPMLLRDRAGEFTRSMLAESAGFDGEPVGLAERADCTRDSCMAAIDREGRRWLIFATRSGDLLDWRAMVRGCAAADIAVSDRRLPPACRPRWLKLERSMLERTGGVAVTLGPQPALTSVSQRIGNHPWAATVAPTGRMAGQDRAAARSAKPVSSGESVPPGGPGSVLAPVDSAAARNADWPDRAGSSVPRGGKS